MSRAALFLSLLLATPAAAQSSNWQTAQPIYSGHSNGDYVDSYGCPDPARNVSLAKALARDMAIQDEEGRKNALAHTNDQYDGCSIGMMFKP